MVKTYKSTVCDLVVAHARELVHERLDLVRRHAEITKELGNPDIPHSAFLLLTDEADTLHREIEILSAKEDVWNCVLKICTEVEE